MNANLITGDTNSLETRFLNCYNSTTDNTFKSSASNGARMLLKDVRIELLDAVEGGPGEIFSYLDSDLNPAVAFQTYRQQNPFIVQLSDLPPNTA